MAGVAGTLFGGAAALLAGRFANELLGIRIVTLFFAVLSVLTLLIAAWSVTGLEKKPQAVGYGWKTYWTLIQDRNVLVLMILKALGAVGTGALTAALPYFAVHILGSSSVSTVGLAIYVLVSAAFIPLWARVAKRVDKRHLLLGANIVIAAVLAVVAFYADAAIIFYIGCFVMGIPMGAYLFIPYSFVPDLVDYYEYKTGERHESIFFGLWITVHQLGIAVSGLLLGLILAWFGYSGEASTQAPSALMAVRIVFGIVPGIFLVLSTIVLQKYTITRSFYQEIRATLQGTASAAMGSEPR